MKISITFVIVLVFEHIFWKKVIDYKYTEKFSKTKLTLQLIDILQLITYTSTPIWVLYVAPRPIFISLCVLMRIIIYLSETQHY